MALLTLVFSGVLGLAVQPAAAINNGSNAQDGQFPYIAFISNGGGVCSGALIRPEWVLTAGHCVNALRPYVHRVWIGGTTPATRVEVAVAGVRRHPDWPNTPGSDPALDLALIRLATPVDTPVVPLAEPSEVASWDGPSDPITAVGWGVTSTGGGLATQLQTKDGTVATSNGILAATFTNGGPCGGDSGSPGLVHTARGLVVAGALSKAGCENGTARYALVGSGPGRDWLLSVLDSGPTARTEHPWTATQATHDRQCVDAADRSTDAGERELVAGIPPQHTSWWVYDPGTADSRRVVVSTHFSTADTVIGVFESTGDTLQHDTLSRWSPGNDDAQGTPQSLHPWVTMSNKPGEKVYLIGVGTKSGTETGRVCVQVLEDYPFEDLPGDAVPLSGAFGSVQTHSGFATGDPAEGPSNDTTTTWYRWTSTPGSVQFSHEPEPLASLSVYRGEVLPSQRVASGLGTVSLVASAGETYYIGLSYDSDRLFRPSGVLQWTQITSTQLSANPPSPVVANTPVTLTATLTPSFAEGSVQFKDGTTPLGNPVTVTNGTASITTTLPVGTHSLTAVFTPANPKDFTGSTSATLPYLVYATATRTTLTAAPNPTFPGVPVALISTVAPANATGTVQFRDGTTALGAPVPVAGGTATLTTSALSTGPHTLTAVFTPTNPVAFGPSTSPPVPLTVRTLF